MFEMNKLSTRHLRMMNALEETLREIARLFQPYVSIFIRFYNLPPSPPLPLYIPSRYCKELKFTQQPRPNSLSRILNFQDPSFPSFYPLARDISRLILHIIFIEPGIERTSRKMADIRITSIMLAKEEKGRGRKEEGNTKWWDSAVNSAWCPPNAPSELLPRCGTASCK